ncbi:hemolysin family protein [Nesterenkonia ebinurensis]|uniref:hemolysin family protein n=1 Tax=Nesterenkonia ebinurensis TaxID=2608252 RepID=UPI00123E19B1|nr:hemolysin family protein [Nesterenkonia ebinurensis]
MTSDLFGLVWLVVLLAGNAFFVAGEFAVLSARRSQIEPKAEAGSKRAKTALYAMEHVSQMLAIAQLGITVCSLLLLLMAEPAIHHMLAVPFEALGVPDAASYVVSLVIALLLVSFLHVTFGEMVPKNFAVSVADKAVLLLSPPLVLLYRVFMPVIWMLNLFANLVLRVFRVTPRDEVISTFTLEELESIVNESKRGGTVNDDAGIIAGALDFTERTAVEIMVPVEELVTVPRTVTPKQVEKAVGRTGFSRFVVESESGGYTGYLHLKDVMALPETAAESPVPVTIVRSLGNMRTGDDLDNCLAAMQSSGSHLARVIDETGTTVGILFLEDVLEVLVGEIHDITQARDSRRQHHVD